MCAILFSWRGFLMSMAKGFGGLILVAAMASAQAHTHLKAATPAEGSTVKAAPENIVLTFSEAARLTALTLQKDGDTEEKKLSPLPTEAAANVTVPVPKLSPGKYTVNWRVVSGDNHIMSGKLHFTVAAQTAAQ
jgi:methionine-rich copper-binding protein CopC